MVANREERIEARLTKEQKDLVARAAALEGLSISSFIVQRAVDSAIRAIEHHEVVRLSADDSRRIAEALLNPPEPNDALRDAVRSYREMTSG
jgi:uncharacterized protein (DUF1778 family)